MKRTFTLLAAMACISLAMGQIMINAFDVSYTEDFTGFTGAGIAYPPFPGQLFSGTWSVTGFSDGDVPFEGTGSTGDFARGVTTGGVSTGGLYAFDDGSNQIAWIQPTTTDFNPGSMIMRMINNTGSEINELDVAYTVYCLNDQDRASNFDFSYSYDNTTFFDVPSLDYVSPEGMDGMTYTNPRSTNITGLSIGNGDYFYIRWTSADVSGSGSRDEFGLDDISVEAPTVVPTPSVYFNTSAMTVAESDPSADFTLSVSSTTDCNVYTSAGASSTATEGMDYTSTIPSPLIFLSGEATTADLSLDIIDDAVDEPDETIVFQIDSVTGSCVMGAPNIITITITDNDTTVLTPTDIADVTMEDADGNAISNGQLVEITGLVYGVNLRSPGLEFFLIDSTAGISVFDFSNDFGYSVQEGDKLNVIGTITQYNGLTEIEPDTVIYISSGNPLKSPAMVTDLGEATESDLVTLQPVVHFVDSTQWLGDGSAFNVDVTDGISTWAMRIDESTELSGMAYSDLFTMAGETFTGFNITGLGSQYDPTSPYLDGYELLPRYASDIDAHFEMPGTSVQDLHHPVLSLYPNPAGDLLTVSSDGSAHTAEILDQLGRKVAAFTMDSAMQELDVHDLAPGIYVLRLTSANGVACGRFVKQ